MYGTGTLFLSSPHLDNGIKITCADDLLHAVEGDEEGPVVIDDQPTAVDGISVIAMAGAVIVPAPMLNYRLFLMPTNFNPHRRR